MKLGILFAGQGSQKVGMGKDFYESSESFRGVFDLLNDEQKKIAFEGPAKLLSDTRNTEPIMVAFALGVYKELEKNNIKGDMFAGLSLGEYSALGASSVFDPKTAVSLVSKRAEFMHDAAKEVDCKMMAVMGMEYENLEKICNSVNKSFAEDGCEGKHSIVQIANCNCPGQIVIAGDAKAVEMASEIALEYGAKRALPLAVSGPFHTSYMKPAGERLAKELKKAKFAQMKQPVVFNAIGREKAEDESIAELLEKQVQSSVYFEDCIKTMAESGIDTFLEIGPGKALSGFVRKTCKGATVINIETAEDFANAVSRLKGEL